MTHEPTSRVRSNGHLHITLAGTPTKDPTPMPDALASYNNPALLAALMDVIAAMPDEPRQHAAAALDEHRITATLHNEPGLDGTPIRVIELGIVDKHGSHTIARLDATRLGL